jgi:AraC-like DNA-binding protein
MVDTKRWFGERTSIPTALERNRERRQAAEAEAAAARDELAALLVRGQAVSLDVAAMSQAAGVSRETAHKLLRREGSVSFKEWHRRADEAGIPPGEQRAAWIRQQRENAPAARERSGADNRRLSPDARQG